MLPHLAIDRFVTYLRTDLAGVSTSFCYCSYPGSVDKLTPNRLGVRVYTEHGYEQ